MARFDSDYVPASAMVIYAHPDDIEFTIAGTVAKWADAGCEITFVLITSGDVGTHDTKYTRKSLARVREREEREAARILGARRVVFLRKGTRLEPTMALRKELVRQIRNRPEVVLCATRSRFSGDRTSNHPDHIVAGRRRSRRCSPPPRWSSLAGPGRPQGPRVYISSTLQPDTWIDIGKTIGRKIASLRAHKSQLGSRDIAPMIYSWAMGKGGPRLRGRKGEGARAQAEIHRVVRIMRLLKDEPGGDD